MKDLFTLKTGPFADGTETITWVAYMDEEKGLVGFRCEMDGETRHIYLNPSSEGDSPDVFVYDGPDGDPDGDNDMPAAYINL